MVKDIPLSEITLRKYEKPYFSNERDAMRKVCLSLGLLQPGDSRDIIVDVLLVLERARKNQEWISSFKIREEVQKIREENSLEKKGVAESNIRRQLKRLRDMMIIDKKGNEYRISEFMKLQEVFDEKIEKFFIPQIIERVKSYLEMVGKELKEENNIQDEKNG